MTAVVFTLTVAVVLLLLANLLLVRIVQDYQRWQREDRPTRIVVPAQRRGRICLCSHVEAIHVHGVCSARTCDCAGFIERNT